MNSQYNSRRLSEIENKEWKNAILHIPAAPRRTSVALFRLATGYDCLSNQLFSWYLRKPKLHYLWRGCNLGRKTFTICRALSRNCISGRYWEARELMRTIGYQSD